MTHQEKPHSATPIESGPRKFKALSLPPDLQRKSVEEARQILLKHPDFAGKHATSEDLEFIQAHPEQYREFQDPRVYYLALEGTATDLGKVCVPYLEWYWLGSHFWLSKFWIGHLTSSRTHILVRE